MQALKKSLAKHKLRSAALFLFMCGQVYLLLALMPYTTRLFINDETRNAFSMDNFFGEHPVPERVMLLDDTNEAFFHRVNVISSARQQINMVSFSITEGVSTDIIVGALLAAAERGVEVNIIHNEIVGTMHLGYRRVLSGHKNINVYGFNRFELLRPHFINANFHDKYITVDNKYLLLGGRNIGDKYYNPDCFQGLLSLDKEVLVYNTDPSHDGVIAEINEYFFAKIYSCRTSLFTRSVGRDWEARKAYFISIYNKYNAGLAAESFDYSTNTVPANRITLTKNDFETARKESIVAYNLMMIAMNSETIIAHSPYLSMTRRSINRLGQVTRGRDVTFVTNSLASTPNIPAFSNYYVSRRHILRATGMQIYEFQHTNASLHGKAYLFDGRLTAIGSFNMNERSMRSDTESMLVIDSEEFFDIVMESLNNYMAMSLRVGANNRYVPCDYVEAAHVPLTKRIIYFVAGHGLRGLRFMF